MSALRSKIVSTLLVAGVAVPASAQGVRERRQELRAERELAALTSAIAPVAASTGSGRVTLNGGAVRVRVTTVDGTLAHAMSAIERDCGSGDYDVALGGDVGPNEGRARQIKLERIVSQEGENGVRASLCIFTADSGAGEVKEPLRRVRYTLGHQLEDGRTALTTVATEAVTALADLFPADRDAPGSDLSDVPRPASSRRALTAVIGRGEYAVRVYQSSLTVESAIASYDAAMSTYGYTTTGTLPSARMYRRDGKSFVVSFLGTTAGSAVTLAPFEQGGSP